MTDQRRYKLHLEVMAGGPNLKSIPKFISYQGINQTCTHYNTERRCSNKSMLPPETSYLPKMNLCIHRGIAG